MTTDWQLYRELYEAIEAAGKSDRLDRLNNLTPDRGGDDSKFVVMFVFDTLDQEWPTFGFDLRDWYKSWLVELRDELED